MPDLGEFSDLGRDAGKAAATHVFDGNTPQSYYRRVLNGYNDGDPAIMDMAPAPLSGEWAGESMPEILGEWADDINVQDTYEASFSDAFWDSVIASCRYQLEDNE